ncbi:Putative E3 ubiquitin-protein ligase HERC2 [Pteropus alecto]|uniref:Putative E3 ubiquitin-protein ligase HERC2 n=1 Tax=Pteropus alecto TaxID=9402 RepID=L5JT05_PTEAL|nr:Putative E3 ubiquitin-protein ligase HERC2 [Pteropus alecto]
MPVRHVRPVRAKKHRQPPAPAAPVVVQLMEMGFPRRNIEFALKSLTGTAGNAAGSPGVEALVGWLLDHADVQVTDLSDADTGSEECSDEEGVDDVDDMAYAVSAGAVVTESQTYKRRADFLSNDDYAVYVRENVQVSGCRRLQRGERAEGRARERAVAWPQRRGSDMCFSSIPILDT